VVIDFRRGLPTPLRVTMPRSVSQLVSLYGASCSSRQALHFWFGEGFPFGSLPLPDAKLAAAGAPQVDFAYGPPPNGKFQGYVLFWKPGLYTLIAKSGGTTLGTATVDVQ
jgi:hypothetical protein